MSSGTYSPLCAGYQASVRWSDATVQFNYVRVQTKFARRFITSIKMCAGVSTVASGSTSMSVRCASLC